MMNRLTMEPGRVVQSTQGRDAGRYFVVLQVVDDRHVLMADGQSRKIDHPKKKKMMHLRPKPIVVNVALRRWRTSICRTATCARLSPRTVFR